MRFFRSILLVAVLLSIGCATRDPVTGRRTYNNFSLEDDVKIGQKVMSNNLVAMKKKGCAVNKDKVTHAKLQTMMKRIAAVSHLPQLPYSVRLFDCDINNAAAAPGGAMMVYRGLYDPKKGLVRDDEELAAVMGHEIAHVNCRHGTEQLTKQQSLGILSIIGSIAVSVAYGSGAGDLFNDAFSVGANLWFPSYSRKHETEADRIGIIYIAKAGYDPRAALRVWERAAKTRGGSKTSIFASHPSGADRMRELRKLLPEAMEEYKKATGSYPAGYTPQQ